MSKDLVKTCQACCFKGQFQNGTWGCALTNQPINLEKDYCSKGMLESYHCDSCNALIVPHTNNAFILQVGENDYRLYCANCYNHIAQ